jgi:hypothetical protein
MPVSIQIDDALARSLRQEAAAQHLSLEEFALQLLRDEVIRLAASKDWPAKNRRRLALIQKTTTVGLSRAEETELELLQAALDKRLEPLDEKLLANLRRMEEQANRIADGQNPAAP